MTSIILIINSFIKYIIHEHYLANNSLKNQPFQLKKNNTDINPDGPRIKEKLMLKIIKKDTPFIDWEDLEKNVEDVVLEVEEEKLKRPQKEDASGNNSGGAEF